jgi:hypothetical protein
MSSEQRQAARLRQIEELAQGWGKLVAEQAFPDGVGLDVDLATMEEVAITAAKALVRGTIQTTTSAQAGVLDASQPCPECGRACPLERRPRTVQVRGGTAALDEPVAHCSACRRDFFPTASGAEVGCPLVQSVAAEEHFVDERHGGFV